MLNATFELGDAENRTFHTKCYAKILRLDGYVQHKYLCWKNICQVLFSKNLAISNKKARFFFKYYNSI